MSLGVADRWATDHCQETWTPHAQGNPPWSCQNNPSPCHPSLLFTKIMASSDGYFVCEKVLHCPWVDKDLGQAMYISTQLGIINTRPSRPHCLGLSRSDQTRAPWPTSRDTNNRQQDGRWGGKSCGRGNVRSWVAQWSYVRITQQVDDATEP